MTETKLTLEQRVERIENALRVQGIIPREPIQCAAPVIPRVIARNVQWAPLVDNLVPSAICTFDCDCVRKVHRQNLLVSLMRKRSGQVVAVQTECGKSIEVEIPKED
jgi:hypothetical protein